MTAERQRDGIPFEKYLGQILDRAPIGITVRDRNDLVVFANCRARELSPDGQPARILSSSPLLDDLGQRIGTIEYSCCSTDPSIARVGEWPARLAGTSDAMRAVHGLIQTAGRMDGTVLVLGESGGGKTSVAQAIHNQSNRADRPFLVVNCAAISGAALARELFGRATGATAGFGRLHGAHGGTLLLDEVCALPLEIQQRLLDAVSGSAQGAGIVVDGVSLDVRLVSSTSKDIENAVESGAFLRPLFFYLNAISIVVPPLRERLCDVPPLVERLIEKHCAQSEPRCIEGIAPDALHALCGYHFPGNVRELDRAIEHAVALCRGKRIRLDHLPKAITLGDVEETDPDASSSDSIELLERDFLIRVLDDNDWKLQVVAQRLGLSRTTLWRKLRRLDIERR